MSDDGRKGRLLADVDELESIADKRGPEIQRAVRVKLIRPAKDPVLRAFFTNASDPKRIRARLEVVRDHALHDELDAAETELRLLHLHLDYVQQQLERPYRAKIAKRIADGHTSSGFGGGRPKGSITTAERNITLALEYQRQQADSDLKQCALMAKIGASQSRPLSRSQSVTAITDGLARLRKKLPG